jgi:PDZ domain-containing secreted protein
MQRSKSRKSKSPGFTQDLYEGAAQWGRFTTGVDSFFSFIVAGFLFILSLYLLSQKGKITAQTSAKITTEEVDCFQKSKHGKVISSYNCGSVEVEYTIDGKVYTQIVSITNSEKELKFGDDVTIYYDPSNPNTIAVSKDNPQRTGWILLGISVLLVLSSLLHLWLVRRYKWVGAVSGIGWFLG